MDPNQETEATANIFRLPFADELEITIHDASGETRKRKAHITFGGAMHTEPFGTAVLTFTSNGTDPVKLVYEDAEGRAGIWLNAFRMSRWHSE